MSEINQYREIITEYLSCNIPCCLIKIITQYDMKFQCIEIFTFKYERFTLFKTDIFECPINRQKPNNNSIRHQIKKQNNNLIYHKNKNNKYHHNKKFSKLNHR